MTQAGRADDNTSFGRLVAEEDELLQQASVTAGRLARRARVFSLADTAASGPSNECSEPAEHSSCCAVHLVSHTFAVEEQAFHIHADHTPTGTMEVLAVLVAPTPILTTSFGRLEGSFR